MFGKSKEDKLIIAGGFFCAAALIFAVTLIWYGSRTSNVGPAGPSEVPVSRPSLPAGTPNPAASLPTTSMQPLGGTITAVGSDRITVENQAVSMGVGQGAPTSAGANTIGAAAGTSVTVGITSTTQIYKDGAPKDAATFQKEMQQFEQTIDDYGSTTEVYIAPDPYTQIPLSLSDLKTGMLVEVLLLGSDQTKAESVQVINMTTNSNSESGSPSAL